MAPPLPVPEHVTEAWLFPADVVELNETGRYWGYGAYVKLGMEARDKAARLLYEYLTEKQVSDLKQTGQFIEGSYVIKCAFGGASSEHPGVVRMVGTRRVGASCIAFDDGQEKRSHALLPLGDRILAILLSIRFTGLW